MFKGLATFRVLCSSAVIQPNGATYQSQAVYYNMGCKQGPQHGCSLTVNVAHDACCDAVHCAQFAGGWSDLLPYGSVHNLSVILLLRCWCVL